jgi:flagellar basal body rod protein FlgG
MLYGLYLSAQGAQAQSTRLEVLANNVANAATAGFKRDFALFQSHPPYDVEHGVSAPDQPGNQNALGGGLSTAKVTTDYSSGPLTRTGGSLDAALKGPGFFQVTDGRQQFLTRDGQFVLNGAGELTQQGSGMRVTSIAGSAIVIPADAKHISIGTDGAVTATGSDGSPTPLGRLALARPANEEQLQKVGRNLFRPSGPVAPAGNDVEVRQGFIEASGVNPVTEMMDLVQASRAFEANINMIKYQDDALGRLLQSAATH